MTVQLGERFLLDWFELESTQDGYRLWSANEKAPVADVQTLPEQCRVCMLASGLEFRCASLAEAEQKIAACRYLGL